MHFNGVKHFFPTMEMLFFLHYFQLIIENLKNFRFLMQFVNGIENWNWLYLASLWEGEGKWKWFYRVELVVLFLLAFGSAVMRIQCDLQCHDPLPHMISLCTLHKLRSYYPFSCDLTAWYYIRGF